MTVLYDNKRYEFIYTEEVNNEWKEDFWEKVDGEWTHVHTVHNLNTDSAKAMIGRLEAAGFIHLE